MTQRPPACTGLARALGVLLFALPALAGADTGAAPPIGTWHGTSTCTVKPSSCNDETVVYHVTRAAGGGASSNAVSVQADKIVDGKALDMGTLDCTWDGAGRVLACTIPKKGTFRFQIDADDKKLTGTLTLTDGTLFRKIVAERRQRD
jgi:hypothetical protein